MTNVDETARLSWLRTLLRHKRDEIFEMLGKTSSLNPESALKPSLLQRFTHMLDQIAEAKDKEKKLLSQIEMIEMNHRSHRERGILREATAECEPSLQPKIQPVPEVARPDNSFWWLLAMWYVLSGQKFRHK